MNKKVILLSICLLGLSSVTSNGYSRSIKAIEGQESNKICKFNETAEVNIRFDLSVEKATEADAEIEKIKTKITVIAKEQGSNLITLKSMNFNLNSQPDSQGGRYQLNGNMRYVIDSYQQSLELIDSLKNAGYRVSLSVNKYRERC